VTARFQSKKKSGRESQGALRQNEQKLRKQIHGKVNHIDNADENK
jgi:hypothetical protein